MVTKDDSKIPVCIKANAAAVTTLSVFVGAEETQWSVCWNLLLSRSPKEEMQSGDSALVNLEEVGWEQRLHIAS